MIRIIYVSDKKDNSTKTANFFHTVQAAAYEAFEETNVMTVDEWNQSGILYATPEDFPAAQQAKFRNKLPCIVIDRGTKDPIMLKGVGYKADWKKVFIATFNDTIKEQKGKEQPSGGDGTDNGKTNGKEGKTGDNGNAERGTSTWGGFGSISINCWFYIGGTLLAAYIALTSKEQGTQLIGGAGAAYLGYKAYECLK